MNEQRTNYWFSPKLRDLLSFTVGARRITQYLHTIQSIANSRATRLAPVQYRRQPESLTCSESRALHRFRYLEVKIPQSAHCCREQLRVECCSQSKGHSCILILLDGNRNISPKHVLRVDMTASPIRVLVWPCIFSIILGR